MQLRNGVGLFAVLALGLFDPAVVCAQITTGTVLGTVRDAQGAVVPGATDTVGTHQYSASLIRTPTVRAISAATVVVDFQYARAYGLRAVIDHAALVGLAEIRPEAVPDNSILSLYTLDNARRELTGRDFSFLAGLYRIPMDREANLQRTALVNQMTGSNRKAAPQRED